MTFDAARFAPEAVVGDYTGRAIRGWRVGGRTKTGVWVKFGAVRASDGVAGDFRVLFRDAIRVRGPWQPDPRASGLAAAQRAMLVRHEGIVPILDAFNTHVSEVGWADLVVVTAPETGTPLSDVLEREQTLTPPRVVRIVRDVLEALRAAHSGPTGPVLHGHINPGSIRLADGAEGERALLVDLGLDAGVAAGLDAVDLLNVEYVALEALMGCANTGPPADLQVLGVVAYRALAGRSPYWTEPPGDNLRACGAKLRATTPPLPAGVPIHLRALVEWLLARDPAERPASADEALAAIASVE